MNFQQPSRSTMRMIFQLALSACQLPGAIKAVQDASNYHEALWEMNDRKEAEKPGGEAPSDNSAVAQHGINSPQAQGSRDARTAARKAADAARDKLGTHGSSGAKKPLGSHGSPGAKKTNVKKKDAPVEEDAAKKE